MLHLMKVYRQPEIQDGGPQKGKSLNVNDRFRGNIVRITVRVTLIINPTIISMFMRPVSRMPLITVPHSLKKRK